MFYEIMTTVQVGRTLQYRLKHFNADLTGWEDKAVVQSFPLVATAPQVWFFNGLTLRRQGSNAMVATVRVGNPDGSSRELTFRYRRIRR